MLDIENGTWNLSDKPSASETGTEPAPSHPTETYERVSAPGVSPIILSSDPPQISLQDMITTSVALKSNVKVDITKRWPSTLFPTITSSPVDNDISLQSESFPSRSNDEVPLHVVEAMARLQREILLLRNELNFELWVSRENVRHIGRLYQDRILSRNAEAERQGLVRHLARCRPFGQCRLTKIVQQTAQISGTGDQFGEGTERTQGTGVVGQEQILGLEFGTR